MLPFYHCLITYSLPHQGKSPATTRHRCSDTIIIFDDEKRRQVFRHLRLASPHCAKPTIYRIVIYLYLSVSYSSVSYILFPSFVLAYICFPTHENWLVSQVICREKEKIRSHKWFTSSMPARLSLSCKRESNLVRDIHSSWKGTIRIT